MAEPGPIRVLIADDEPLARLWLRQLVLANTRPRCEVVAEAADGVQALALLEDGALPTEVDVILLDIAMPGLDGVRLAQQLRRRPSAPAVVFVTAHAEHALRAFELQALDYLTKPVQRDRLREALVRVAHLRIQPVAQVPMLVTTERGRVLRIPSSEVLYLKAEQKYVTLRTATGHWLLDESLNDLEQRLGAGFLRVHRNALVALHTVRALESSPAPETPGDDNPGDEHGSQWVVRVSNGEWLAVSRRQLTAVREAVRLASGPASPQS